MGDARGATDGVEGLCEVKVVQIDHQRSNKLFLKQKVRQTGAITKEAMLILRKGLYLCVCVCVGVFSDPPLLKTGHLIVLR